MEVKANYSYNPEEDFMSFFDKDKKTDEWILQKTPFPVVLLLVVYLAFVLKVGPQMMKSRSPFKLKWTMRLYNLVQIIYNAFMIHPFFWDVRRSFEIIKSSSWCNANQIHVMENMKDLYLVGFWLYVVLKQLDLLDTVFMVLRKKEVSFLHVYHHTVMVFCSWYTLKYIKPPQAVLPGALNCIVHTIMYTYYLLATFGPKMERYLWWKIHLTKLQLAQFVIALAYISSLNVFGCQVSKGFTYIWATNVIVIMCLFINFYIQEYIIKNEKKIKKR